MQSMSDLEDSTGDTPQERHRRRRHRHRSRRRCALSKKTDAILRVALVSILFLLVVFCRCFMYNSVFTGDSIIGIVASLAVQSVAYLAIAGLYIYTCSSWRGRVISGVFLGSLAMLAIAISMVVRLAGTSVELIFGANIVGVSVYCFWQFPLLLAWAWHRFLIASATVLATHHSEQKEAAELETRRLLQHTAFRIEGLPQQYSYEEIEAMTKNFGSMVGRGGSATVYMGCLDDGTAVAVKRIALDQSSVGEVEFLTEVNIVAGVQHRSLVRLLGYCLLRGGDRYLVYPFFENRSLDSWLFGGEERRRHLPWPTRRRIAVDVARALAYLHHECRWQILHLDIKPANILLDEGLRAHVSDFGISMSIGRDLSSVDTCGRGTVGYMAPEMLVRALSAKSDVYSYGMTLFELVGGRRNFELADGASSTPDFSRDYFPCVVRDRFTEGRLMEVVDATMARDDEAGMDLDEVKVVVKVALWCIQHNRDARPSMPTVVDMLEGRVPVEPPPENRMFALNFSEPLSSTGSRGPL